MQQRAGWFAGWLLALASSPLMAQDPLLEVLPGAGSGNAEVRGVLRSQHQAVISSELAGRLTELPFAEGQRFRKGEVLARFDCSAYEAQLQAARASVRVASEQLAHNRQLAQLKSVGRFEVAQAEARYAEAAAQSKVYQVQVERCVLKAPFDGQLVARRVQPHESVSAGSPLLEVVDNQSLEVHLLVPSRWLGRLQPGQHFRFIPDETGQPLDVEVLRLGARIDEGSQTLLLIGQLPADATGLLAGMSGSAQFAEQP